MRRILAMAVALVFVFSLVSVVGAAEKQVYTKDDIYSVRGPVLSVDGAAKTLTVKSIERTKSPAIRWKGDMTFLTGENTKFAMGKKAESFQDLKAGEKVIVKFHEKDGKYIADIVRIAAEKHG